MFGKERSATAPRRLAILKPHTLPGKSVVFSLWVCRGLSPQFLFNNKTVIAEIKCMGKRQHSPEDLHTERPVHDGKRKWPESLPATQGEELAPRLEHPNLAVKMRELYHLPPRRVYSEFQHAFHKGAVAEC